MTLIDRMAVTAYETFNDALKQYAGAGKTAWHELEEWERAAWRKSLRSAFEKARDATPYMEQMGGECRFKQPVRVTEDAAEADATAIWRLMCDAGLREK